MLRRAPPGGLPIVLGARWLGPLWLERGAFAAPVSLWPAPGVVYNMPVCFVFCRWAWFRTVAMAPLAARGLGTMSIPVIGVVNGGLLLGQPSGAPEVRSGLVVVVVVVVLAAVAMPGRAARASPAA